MSAARGDTPVLEIEELSIGFPRATGSPVVVDGATLDIGAGEIHGLVGESGSGKTMLARAVLDLLPPGAEVSAGRIAFRGESVRGRAAAMRRLRGRDIGMVFQEPMMSLNPALRIGEQMAEGLRLHTDLSAGEIRARGLRMLERVRMPDPAGALSRYPHEFSGGMRQRIMLASVLLPRPALLLADEPTTALDVLIQKEVLEIMLEIVRDLGTSVLLITHDLGLVARYAQRLTVMERGRVIEQGTVSRTLRRPREAYTRRLLAALPLAAADDDDRDTGCGESCGESGPADDALLRVRDLSVTFGRRSALPWRQPAATRAVDGVSFDIRRHETLAVVGESGSGKTTLGRAVLKLVAKTGGEVRVGERDIDQLAGREERAFRRAMQIVFQDPYSSLDPRKRIGAIVGEGLRLVPGLGRAERRKRVERTMEEVGIDPDWAGRYPHELSGGQRQRIGIARAIVTEPRLVVADEAVSALDLTVQAQVLKLLKRLQRRRGFSYLFISHDLGVVRQIADRILVMHRGRIVELGGREDVFERPRHLYTCALLNAVPELSGDPERGYRLHERSVAPPPPPRGYAMDRSHEGAAGARAELMEVAEGHFAAYAPATRAGSHP